MLASLDAASWGETDTLARDAPTTLVQKVEGPPAARRIGPVGSRRHLVWALGLT